MPESLQARAEEHVRDLTTQAADFWSRTFAIPTVTINRRLRTTAGRAWPQRWEIELNPYLCDREGDAFVREVVAHELAHLLDYRLHRGRGHGPGWRAAMATLGFDPERTHQRDTDGLRRRRRRFIYRCACPEPIPLGPIRHRNIARGQEYRCRRCHQAIYWTGGENWLD